MERRGVLIVDGFPASVGSTASKAAWVERVRAAAASVFSQPLTSQNLHVKLVVAYDPHLNNRQRFDVHNMAKPIFDALRGIAYNDDSQISRTEISKRSVDGAYRVEGIDGRIVTRLGEKREFVYLELYELSDEEVASL